jgi:hypothetical protein
MTWGVHWEGYKYDKKKYGVHSKKCEILVGLPILGGEISMSVKFPRRNMNGATHVGESAIS